MSERWTIEGFHHVQPAMPPGDVADDPQLDGHERCDVRDPLGNRLELIEEVEG